jgi:hypothetical protein
VGAEKCCNESCDLPRTEGLCSKSGKPKQACSTKCFKAQEARLAERAGKRGTQRPEPSTSTPVGRPGVGRLASQQQSTAQGPTGRKAKVTSTSDGSSPSGPPSSRSESEDDDMWRCSHTYRDAEKKRVTCLRFNGKGASKCSRCSMPRYEHMTLARRRRRRGPPTVPRRRRPKVR